MPLIVSIKVAMEDCRNQREVTTMMHIRPAQERGEANFGWLDSRHTFSFGHYFDDRYMGFGPLRVINEDRVKPGAGFDTHGHRDMEILSYVVEGELAHRDNTGTGSVIRRGDIQRMTAGSGILHSEFNHSSEEPVHFLQIWIHPDRTNLAPGYEQKTLDPADRKNRLVLIASPQGGEHAVLIHQDARIYAGELDASKAVTYTAAARRGLWLQMIKGQVTVGEAVLSAGDGAQFTDEALLRIKAVQDAEFLLFDLPPAP
ncbi:MAG: pirin family protein [Pseudomonadota bacterium]|nr:pirin family protein [Pseudomonadota bacterium]